MFLPTKFGTGFLGKKDVHPDLSYVSTKWFFVLFFPVIPLGTYRIWKEKEGILIDEFKTEKLKTDWNLTVKVGAITIASLVAIMLIMFLIFYSIDHFNQHK